MTMFAICKLDTSCLCVERQCWGSRFRGKKNRNMHGTMDYGAVRNEGGVVCGDGKRNGVLVWGERGEEGSAYWGGGWGG